MTKKNQQQPKQDTIVPHVLEIAPPGEVDGDPPKLANIVQVRGSADCVRINFYYFSELRMNEVDRRQGPGIEKINNNLTVIRQPAIARVSLPVSAMVELMAQLAEVMGRASGDFSALGATMAARFTGLVPASPGTPSASVVQDVAFEPRDPEGSEDDHGP